MRKKTLDELVDDAAKDEVNGFGFGCDSCKNYVGKCPYCHSKRPLPRQVELIAEHSGCGLGVQVDQITVRLSPGDRVYMVRKGALLAAIEIERLEPENADKYFGVEQAAKRICQSIGLDWAELPETAENDSTEDREWFRMMARAALRDAGKEK